MTPSSTFERRFRRALELEGQGDLKGALDALHHVFDPLEDPSERRVASAEFNLRVELRKADVLTALGRRQEALELLEADWIWRLVNETDETTRLAFFTVYGDARAGLAGKPWTVEPDALLQKLQSAIIRPHQLRGWEAFFRSYAH